MLWITYPPELLYGLTEAYMSSYANTYSPIEKEK